MACAAPCGVPHDSPAERNCVPLLALGCTRAIPLPGLNAILSTTSGDSYGGVPGVSPARRLHRALVSCDCLDLRVAEEPRDHRRALAQPRGTSRTEVPQIVQPHAVSPQLVHWSDGSTGRSATASHLSCRPRSPGERRRVLARLLDSAPLQATAGPHAGRSRAFRFLTETLSHPIAYRSRYFLEFARLPAQPAPPRERPRSGGPRSRPVARPPRTESSCRESSSRFDPA